MYAIFVDALVHPENYEPKSAFYVTEQVLQSLEKLFLKHRIEILSEALPQMFIAQYAHDVMRTLLDQVFFGAVRPTTMSSLMPTQIAERPIIAEENISADLSRSWSYPANPTKLNIVDILPMQRTTLEMVLALEIPWMVHSNLLEKYGLPATREAVRNMLRSDQKSA